MYELGAETLVLILADLHQTQVTHKVVCSAEMCYAGQILLGCIGNIWETPSKGLICCFNVRVRVQWASKKQVFLMSRAV